MANNSEVAAKTAPFTREHFARLGRRIAEQREARGWKQTELSRRASIGPSRLSRIERGKAQLRLEELVRLRATFGLSLDELVLGHFAAGAESEEERLARALKEAAPAEDRDVLVRLLRTLLTGYRIDRADAAEAAEEAAP